MDATPYYAPTYFSPSYFSVATSPSSPSVGVSPYNAPTYFPPSYFFGGGSLPTPVAVVTDPQGRDEAAYASIIALIRATGVFEGASIGTTVQQSQSGADGYPMALVIPRGWEESDDYDPISLVRRASFGIKIVVKSEDGSPQFNRLDRLSTAILNILDGSDLDGNCLPPLTRIHAGRYDSSTHFPEQSIELEGEFSSIVDPLANVPVTSS